MQKLCQLDQGVMVSSWQKTMASVNSAPTTSDAAAQTEMWWEGPGARLRGEPCSWMAAVSTRVGCVQGEERLGLVTELRVEE